MEELPPVLWTAADLARGFHVSSSANGNGNGLTISASAGAVIVETSNNGANSANSSYGHGSSGSSRGTGDIDAGLHALLDRALPRQPSRKSPPGNGLSMPPALVPNEVLTDPKEASHVASLFAQHARQGDFGAALHILNVLVKAHRHETLERISHRHFLRSASAHGAVDSAFRFIQLLPSQYTNEKTYNMLLGVCIQARNVKFAIHATHLMNESSIKIDYKHYTQLILACAAGGSLDRAFRFYHELKNGAKKPDAKVFGALISSCAEAMRSDTRVVKDRKEQLVLLERAFQVLQDARKLNVRLRTPVLNALVTCAGRCNQLERAFQVLDEIEAAGLQPDVVTYGALLQACILAGQPEKALAVYRTAREAGAASGVQLYSAAICAASAADPPQLDAGWGVYEDARAAGVAVDDRMYGSLIVLAGRAGDLERAFGLVADIAAAGLGPTPAVCSALLHACLLNDSLEGAREVYDRYAAHGVFPAQSQFNALMEAYAVRWHIGDVVSLLGDMCRAGVAPSVNTYRVLLRACGRADQAELAFEVLNVMRAKGMYAKERNAQNICHTMLKICYNRIRQSWQSAGGYRPVRTAAGGSSGVAGSFPGSFRPVDSQLVLQLLAPGQRRLGLLDSAADINWSALAVMTYRDFVQSGMRPAMGVLDKLLACLRLHRPAPQPAGVDINCHVTRQLHRELELAHSGTTDGDELRFDKRAIAVVEDAVNLGILPPMRLEEAATIDLRSLLPHVAEVYVAALLVGAEHKAAVSQQRRPFIHPLTFLVPPFDANYVMWPSAVEKLNMHYEDSRPERKRRSRRRRKQQPAAAVAVAGVGAPAGGSDMSGSSANEDSAMDSSFDEESSYHQSARSEGASLADGGQATSATGLGVAAVFRQLKVFVEMDAARGTIRLAPGELNRWVFTRRKREESGAAGGSVGGVGGVGGAGHGQASMPAHVGLGKGALSEQQRSIRLGMMPGGGGSATGGGSFSQPGFGQSPNHSGSGGSGGSMDSGGSGSSVDGVGSGGPLVRRPSLPNHSS